MGTDLAERYTVNAVLANGGTGRIEIWTSGIDLYFNQANLFRQVFGYGSATIAHAFADYGYRRASLMHNLFLENPSFCQEKCVVNGSDVCVVEFVG